MRISDWSSDVCSSDLGVVLDRLHGEVHAAIAQGRHQAVEVIGRARGEGAPIGVDAGDIATLDCDAGHPPGLHVVEELRDRKSVVSGKSVSVRVDLGGSGIIKKKKQRKIMKITI